MGILVWLPAGLLCAVLLVAVLGFSRLRLLSRHVGSFETRLRITGDSPESAPWSSGFGVYHAERLDWWRSRSLRPSPKYTWHRDDFVVVGREPLDHAAGQPEQYLVHCRHRRCDFDLIMSPEAYSGLTSWTEAAPPSVRHYVV